MSENPKVVRIEYEWSDGTVRRATGDDADAIDRHISGMFGEMQVVRGRTYAGPTMQVVAPGEVERRRADCARVLKFIDSEEWAAMNNRRAGLIDRDIEGTLAVHEKAELATLQFVSGLVVDLRCALDGGLPTVDLEPVVRALESVTEGLEAENVRLAKERDALALMWFREMEGSPEGEERLHGFVGGAVYGPIDEATAIEAARRAAGLKGGPR